MLLLGVRNVLKKHKDVMGLSNILVQLAVISTAGL
jgi:hypothetical protein